MRIVKDDDVPQSFEGARQLEQRGALKDAVALYQKLLKHSAKDLKIITRLIILQRKLKNYAKEISAINKAIKVYEQRYTPKKVSKAVSLVSKKLNILLGHTDKKGKNLLLPDEIIKLQKRKTLLQKKL